MISSADQQTQRSAPASHSLLPAPPVRATILTSHLLPPATHYHEEERHVLLSYGESYYEDRHYDILMYHLRAGAPRRPLVEEEDEPR